MTNKTTDPNWVDRPLNILISSRVRLTNEQRKLLKNAYYGKKNALQPSESTGRGGLSVTTAFGGSNDLDKELGFSQLVFTDLVNSRDSINLNIVIKLQKVLGVELITEDEIVEASKRYCDYVFNRKED